MTMTDLIRYFGLTTVTVDELQKDLSCGSNVHMVLGDARDTMTTTIDAQCKGIRLNSNHISVTSDNFRTRFEFDTVYKARRTNQYVLLDTPTQLTMTVSISK